MRILFDSKKIEYKDPFGCLVPGQECTLHIHIPATVKTTAVKLILTEENGAFLQDFLLVFDRTEGAYDVWKCTFSLEAPGLFFYYFQITGHTGAFRLFKQGDDTNMEDGDCWQISCIPNGFSTPDWAKGAVIYQVFPDRFYRSGDCDLAEKLTPYSLHESWDEEVDWQPDSEGKILNNDFFGGNFRGIRSRLDFLAEMGVQILYLNPISKAFSSHRYDTADYLKPDPMLGTLQDFSQLCQAAHQRNIRVVLDGVYSHTGSDSVYFDKENTFGGGACSNPDSDYRKWYLFKEYPSKYESWWGFETLPTLNKHEPSLQDFICSVMTHWLALGADGFRLDVADELPDSFILKLKEHIRDLRPDALLMGEVWEDASNKIAYDVRRRYFIDGELDSVMNYPYRTAILDLLWGRDDGRHFRDKIMTILENYPRQVSLCNMNMLGTHDTPRILTALVDDFDGDRATLAQRKLTPEQLELGKKRLKLAAVLQFALPGCPSIYYGDEAGMEGGKDPFNRRTYPWGKEDHDLRSHFRTLGQIRKSSPALRLGETEFFSAESGKIGILRRHENQVVKIYVNLSGDIWNLPNGQALASMDWLMEGQ